jgi:hypothetical protein
VLLVAAPLSFPALVFSLLLLGGGSGRESCWEKEHNNKALCAL